MNQAIKVVVIAAVAGSVALTAACGSSSSSDTATSKGSISIGVIVDKTGVTASTGIQALNGIEMAVDETNKDGGIEGKKIKLIVQDGASEATVAAAAARTLSSQTQAVIGANTGGSCRAMQPILDAAKVLEYCLSPQTITPTPAFFSALAPVNGYVPATIPWLKAKGYNKIAFIGQNDATGDGYYSVFTYIQKTDPTYQVVSNERDRKSVV